MGNDAEDDRRRVDSDCKFSVTEIDIIRDQAGRLGNHQFQFKLHRVSAVAYDARKRAKLPLEY